MKYKKLLKIAEKLQKDAPWAIDEDGLWIPKDEDEVKKCEKCQRGEFCFINW